MVSSRKIVWISDLHVTTSGMIGQVPCAARLAQAVEQINRWHDDADCCIATGDLVDTGALEEYELLAGIVENLSVPFLPMIGNHDNRANLLAAFPPPGEAMLGYYQYRHDLGDVTLLCLDTHLPGDDAGALDAARLDWLAGELARTAERRVLVFMHHPPGPLGLGLFDDIPLRDHEPLIALLAGAPQVAHLFFGHVHRPVSGAIGGIPFTALRSTAHQALPPHHLHDWADFIAHDERPQYGVILPMRDRLIVQALDLEEPA